MQEKQLLERFKKLLIELNSVDDKYIDIADKNKSKKMDFNFTEPATNRYISLEAKTFNDTRSNSNYFLSLFGKIIKGRTLNKDNASCKGRKVEYGFLFCEENSERIKKYFSIIDKDDWLKFCEHYELTLIYICGENKYDVFDSKSFIEDFLQEASSEQYFSDENIIESEETDEETEEIGETKL